MPKPKKIKQSSAPKPHRRLRKKWFWILGVLAVLLVAIFARMLTLSLDQQRLEKADRDKFSKIETLVDSIKVDLEKTYPDKQWEIVKYCQASRGEFGNVVAVTCTYGVKGPGGTTIEELSPAVVLHMDSLGVRTDSAGDGVKYEAFRTGFPGICRSYPSTVIGLPENFGCSSGSSVFLYPEIPRY